MRRKLVVGLAVAGAVGLAVFWLPLPATLFSTPQVPEAAPPEKRGESAKAEARFAALPERTPLGKPRGALFDAPPPPKPAAPAPVLETKPTAPPVPYRVAGVVAHDGTRKIVLVKGDQVLPVSEGDMLEGGYRVEAVGADEITLLYSPLGTRERLPLAAASAAQHVPAGTTAAAGGSQPAQLRWEGPQQVRTGTTFNLALKVTSNEPLRASPLQISYDAALLEAVSVRPGSFFAGNPSFSYRINPGGFIFVGASGTDSSPASDAELVVLTFKPIRPSAAAEVKIAALQLQGAVGKAIAAEPVSPFRTSITP